MLLYVICYQVSSNKYNIRGKIMKIIEILNEAFESAVPYKWVVNDNKSAVAEFVIVQPGRFFSKKLKYGFDAFNYGESWKIAFYQIVNGKKVYTKTGTGNEKAVFSTVVEIMKDFFSTHEVNSIIFSAEEKNRQSLYSRLAKTFLPSWKITHDIAGGVGFYTLTKP